MLLYRTYFSKPRLWEACHLFFPVLFLENKIIIIIIIKKEIGKSSRGFLVVIFDMI